jgi:hypothetical protein
MSFTLDSSSRDRGEVDFDGSGLAALSGTYFSLEGALDAASLKAREGHLIGRYVAVGDSYSSGEGATDDDAGDPVFQDGTDTSSNKCHRSDRAYGARIKADQHVSSDDFVFKACSGAILADFVADLGKAGQWTDGPQLNAVSAKDHPRSDTGLVTLSLGGNDAGFPFVLDDCVDGFGHGRGENGCLNSISRHLADAKKLLADGGTIVVNPDDKVQGISNASWKFCDKTCVKAHAVFGTSKYVTTVPSLAGLYNEIHRRAPSARIRVLQYPYLFPANPPKKCTAGQFHAILATHSYTLTQKEMLRINTAIYDLDSLIANQVILALHPGEDIREVDPRPAFSGHEICSANPWINGVVFRGHFLPTAQSPFSFHPTSTGQRHFADVVEAAL